MLVLVQIRTTEWGTVVEYAGCQSIAQYGHTVHEKADWQEVRMCLIADLWDPDTWWQGEIPHTKDIYGYAYSRDKSGPRGVRNKSLEEFVYQSGMVY